MKTATKKVITLSIKEIGADRYNQLVISAQPNEHNATGNYVMNAQQEAFLLQRAGVPNRLALKHLVALSNGSCKLSYTAQFCKAGEAWDNNKEGAAHKSGTYTKDWTQFGAYNVELGFAALQLVSEWSFKMGGVAAPVIAAPVRNAQPIIEEATEETTDEVVNDVPNV